MIVAALRGELVKLRRPTLLVGTYVGLGLAASLFTILLFVQAPRTGGGGLPGLSELARPDGLIHGVSQAAVLLGVVAFGIAASQIANEYSLGTLRQLLVRQPRRTVFLAGKYLGVLLFLVGAVIFSSVVATGVAFLMAHLRGVPTAAWTSSTGIADLTRALGDLVLATVGFATLGLIVGLLFRSSVAAIIVGFVWLLPFETIIVRIVPQARLWLPGQLLQLLAAGGSTTVTFSRALVLSACYLLVAVAAGIAVFQRKDVTA
jgi:ABC-2 type transport system permease protein